MGSACCGERSDSGVVAPNRQSGTAGTAADKYKLPAVLGSKAATASGTQPRAGVDFQEDVRARARDRAEHALLESLENNEAVIPSLKWRRQHLKSPGMGTFIAGVIGRFLARCNDSRTSRTGGTSPPASAPPASGARNGSRRGGSAKPQTVAAGGAHGIVTLDFRGMRIGDEGLAALAPALLADTCVSNVLLAHNDITDRGVELLEAAVQSLRPSASGSSADGIPSAMELLILADNPISSSGLARLARNVLPYMAHLDRIEVGEGSMGSLVAAGAGGVAEGGWYDVDGELLSDDTVRSFIEYIRRATSLSTFVFKGSGNYYNKTGFSPDGLRLFVQQVVGRSSLAELYLQECYTTKPSMLARDPASVFVPQRKGNAKAGTVEPDAGARGAGGETDEQVHDALLHNLLVPIHTLSEALCAPTTALVTLVLRIPLCDEAMVVLCRGLSSASRLENLSLRGCDLSANGLQRVADALTRNKSIVMLDVSFQSNMIAHPSVLAEMRSSSKRRQSVTNLAATASSGGMTGTLDARRLDDYGDTSVPTRDQREHPLLPIIKALHVNRTLVRLVMLGINISISDLEELCDCIEVSHNRVLCEVAYTNIGVEALNTKLETFLSANSTYGNGTRMRESVVSPSSTAMNSARYRSVSASSAAGGGSGAVDYFDASMSESVRNSISLSDAFGTYGGGGNAAGAAAAARASPSSTTALPRPRSSSRASSPSASLPSMPVPGTSPQRHNPPLPPPRARGGSSSTDQAPPNLARNVTRQGFNENYEAFQSDDEARGSSHSVDSYGVSGAPPQDLSTTGRLY